MNEDYRKDIDGLRAIAVISVVINHIFPSHLPGGFVGVDIFFVISGYLITGHLFKDLISGNFSIVTFYAKRVKRIFPALILVLFLVYVYGFAYVLADQFKDIGKHIAGGAGFLSNFVLMNESGYFDANAETKLLLHLWSLAVEEQFYIFWPIIIFLVYKIKRHLSFTLLLILLSFAVCVLFTDSYPVEAFYSPVTRAWELLFGAALALISYEKNSRYQSRDISNIASYVGLVMIGVAVINFDKGYTYPDYWAIFPVAGAAILIVFENSIISQKFLSSKLMVGIGVISYPLYLWHWPLITVVRDELGRPVTISEGIGVIILSVMLAWVTWRFVELPIRYRNALQVRYLLLLMLIIGVLGFNAYYRDGITTRHRYLLGGVSEYYYDKEKDQRRHTCFLMDESDQPHNFSGMCTSSVDRSYKIVLWGDSHAAAFYPGLRKLELQGEIGVSQFNIAGCGGYLADGKNKHCDAGNLAALQQITRINPDLVILHKKWQPKDINKFRDTVSELKNLGLKVLVIGPTPRWSPDLPGQVVKYWRRYNNLPPAYWQSGLDEREVSFEEDEKWRIESNKLGAIYYSAYNYMCKRDIGCLVLIPNTPNALTVYDGTHISSAAAIYIAEDVYTLILRNNISEKLSRSK